jgi:metal-responsive CopG/Arc/MetJ family transcriptional regulator
MSSISVRLPDELQQKLDRAAEEEGANRSELLREAVSTYLQLREFQRLRREMIPKAESQGTYTDEDVFEDVS